MADTFEKVSSKEQEVTKEVIPSMDDFKDEINRSFRSVKEGDLITGTIIGITETDVMVDLGYYAEGIIKASEASNDPSFSIKSDLTVGDLITAVVLREDDGEGNVLLSLRQAHDVISWDKLSEAMENRTVYSCKIKETTHGGLITYIEGLRAFIPASQITTSYVEDLEAYKGKTIDAIVITADQDKNKLVLSGREVQHEKEEKEHNQKVSSLQIGLVTTGKVETIMPYGAFVNLGDGLSGLVHISQICGRHLKSPKEVLSEGQDVKVKIIDVKDGKISLSIKAVEEQETVVEDLKEAPIEYIDNSGEAATSLGALLSKFKFD